MQIALRSFLKLIIFKIINNNYIICTVIENEQQNKKWSYR